MEGENRETTQLCSSAIKCRVKERVRGTRELDDYLNFHDENFQNDKVE